MVSSFSNPGFPPVDVHPTRLPAMDARLSAAIDSFEASMRAALRDALREALDSAFANFTANFSRDWALLRRDSALRAEGVSDPVPTTSNDTQSIDLGQTGLQGDDNPPRLPSPVQVHSVPPLLSSSPLLRALATPVVKPQSIDSVAAIVSLLGSKTVLPDSVMTTASQLLPDCSASMFSNLCPFSGNEFTPPTFFRKSGAEFMQAQPSMIAHKCQQGLVGMYARYVFDEIPDSCCCVVLDRNMCYCKGIQDKGGGSTFRSPDECRRKLEEKIAKSNYDVSIGCFITKKLHVWCQLPRVLWIRRHEVLRSLIYNLSHGEAKWYWILLFILAYYTGVIVILYEDSLTEKCGWVNWYLVGKFVKKNLFALHLFDELPKRWRENNMAISEVMKGRFSNEYFPSDSSNNHSIAQTILLLRKLCRTNRGEQGRAAANTCCLLLLSQSDNNVKLIVLDRLTELKSSHRKGVADMFMDVLRALSSHNLDIRRKTLDIVFSLVTCTNINELVLILKREVVKTHTGELEKNGEYRQMLIQAIHSCAIKFPEVASTLVHLLMEFLGGSNVTLGLVSIISRIRTIIATAQISQAQPVRLLLHGAISGALYAGHIHSLLQRECITESFLRGLSWLLRFIDKWIHSMDLENHKLNLRIEHYGCIVDLLNSANLLNVAEKFIRDMPTQPDVVIWGSRLFTCRIYGNIELAELVDKRTGVFEPQGAYVNSPRDAGSSLIWDVGHGHQDAVEVLLQNNANLVAENNDSITPLQSSVLVGSLPCLESLVHIDHPNMRITPWEVALILGQWVSDIKKDIKMLVYCALIRLLQDKDLSVRLAACRSLCLHSEDARFSEGEFINLLPIYWNSCLKLIKEDQELDSKKAWVESANECLLQIQLLVALRTAANWEDFHNSIFKP